MLKTIFKAVAVSAVAAFFCVGCGDKNDDGGEESGETPGEGGGPKSSYTVTFNPNGGTVSPTSAKTDEDGILASLPTPTRNGYDFDGWFTAATEGTAVSVGNVYSANTTIYAHWTDVSVGRYTIKFNPNGGTVSPTSGKTDNDGVLLVPLPTPTRSGYTFDGWYTSSTGGTKIVESRVFGGNATIYARWTATGIPTPDKTTFVDSRDGKTYNKVLIGSQIWMAENLNYAATGSRCLDNSLENCTKFGRLYSWGIAMNDAPSSNRVPSGVQGVCPSGWHLPSDSEWRTLENYVGGSKTAGKKLKSTSDWGDGSSGTDEYGFSALKAPRSSLVNGDAIWWTTTDTSAILCDGCTRRSYAFLRSMYTDEDSTRRVYTDPTPPVDGYTPILSVRCVMD